MLKKGISFCINIEPRTKKNSSRIVIAGKKRMILPSKAYMEFEKASGKFLQPLYINFPINLECKFYMKTKRKVDLNNLLSAITDVLVKYNVIIDDNKDIVQSFDGSRVYYDAKNPRIEVKITKGENNENKKS